jgi:hypothetical protein
MSISSEIDILLDDYRHWLKDKTSLREIDATWVEITTPYLDRHNDSLQIYAKKTPTGYLLSDDSYTLHDLELSGCSLTTQKRLDLLRLTLNGFGVRRNEDALEVEATKETFAYGKHNLIQSMLAVNDLFYLAQPMVTSLFFEDVTSWLDLSDIRYTPKVKFTGVSGYDHLFDFVIPKSTKQPERIVQAINRPTRDSAEAFIYKWSDTRNVRPQNSQAFAFLNDQVQPLPAGVMDAFKNYQINPVVWSQRDQEQARLAA